MVRPTFVVLMLFLPNAAANAQSSGNQVLNLSLKEAIETAQNQSFSVQDAAFESQAAQHVFSQTRAVFLPSISFEYDIVSTNDPLNVFGFKLKQERVTQQDFDPSRLNSPDAFENYSARIKVQQPLFNPDMFLARSAARSQMNSSREQLASTKNHIRFQVTRLYFELVLHGEQLNVIREALLTAEEFERQSRIFFDEGLINREDLLTAQVHRLELESKKLGITNKQADASANLAHLLGYDSSISINPTDILEQINGTLPDIDPAEILIDNAYLRAISHKAEAASGMLRSSLYGFLPKINVFGQYEFNDSDFGGFEASSYLIGANLTWNIFSGYQKAGRVSESRVRARQAETMLQNQTIDQQNRLESAWRALEHAGRQIEVRGEAIEQATENIRIRSNRYQEGMESTTDLLQAQTRLSEARLNQLVAIFQYNMSVAAIEMLLEL